MNQEIGSLKQSYAKMIENQPKEEQQVQLQVFNEAQAKARAVAAKEQEYASLAGQLRQEQAQIQMELGQLATKRFKAESELRKAKQQKTMADSKAGGGEVKDEDFSFAIGSFDASEDRLKSTRAVCKCSESTPDNLCSALGSSSNSRASGNSTREQ
jgi:predicted RNA-binding protein with RPS1 domain